MKNHLKKLFLPLSFFLFISTYSFSQMQKSTGSAAQNSQVETMIVKAIGVKADNVFNEYKNLLAGLKGVSITGRTLENEYLVIEIDKNQHQVIDVLQPMKDAGYNYEFLYENPSPQKIRELFANDPLIK
ncbi:MAG: hypothetical protein ABIT08_08135 [Bacteroidia bacterium]